MTAGYFAAPQPGLDPNLFDVETLRPNVRSFVIKTVTDALRAYGLRGRKWMSIWIAGSGISFQWGNGDLDVMVTMNRPEFLKANPQYAGVDVTALADDVNAWMRTHVWTVTSASVLNGATYEVTFFLQGERGPADLNAYAAYDVLADRWLIRPPAQPATPSELTHPSWYRAADAHRELATDIKSRYDRFSRQIRRMHPGTPGHHNAGVSLNLVTAQARSLFDELHRGRREAFAEQGHGYRDIHNFFWQRAKATGVITDLVKILDASKKVQEKKDTELYGAPISGAEDALRRAELWKSGRL